MLREPQSADECVYFTNRESDNIKIKCWVFRELCVKCGKGLMGKPREKGKVKIRANEYVCPECGYKVDKDEYEDSLTANIKYKCKCSYEGETQIPFKRRKIQRVDEETGKKQSVEALRFQCGNCKENIDISKKMK